MDLPMAITAHPDAPCVVVSGSVLVVTWGLGGTAVVCCGGCSSRVGLFSVAYSENGHMRLVLTVKKLHGKFNY